MIPVLDVTLDGISEPLYGPPIAVLEDEEHDMLEHE
jgi:hypothetical protein